MSHLRILHTNFLTQWVGESKHIFNLVHQLTLRGHKVILASPKGAAINQRARDLGVPVVEDVTFASGISLANDTRDFITLRELIRDAGIQVVHTHGSKDSWTGALAARSLSGRLLVIRTRHNIFPVRRHWPNRILYHQLTDHVVAISNNIKDSFSGDGFVRPERLSLIHTGIDLEPYRMDMDRSVIRRELGISDEEPLVGMVASLVPYKGQADLLEAAALILKQQPVNILLVGSCHSSGRAPLEEQARRLGIEERIKMWRFRPDVPQILAALDVFTLPSRQEGLGTAIMEALAMGKPVVATNVGGIPDLIQPEVTGLLVPPSDPEKLSQAILRLLNDRSLGERLGRAGREMIERDFTIQGMTDKTEALYYRLLG